MKYFLLLLTLLLTTARLAAQGQKPDKIIKKDNSHLEVRIVEINEKQVRYRKFSNLDGPVYSISKSDLVVVVYANGEIVSFSGGITQVDKKGSEKPAPQQAAVQSPSVKPQPDERAVNDPKPAPANEISSEPKTIQVLYPARPWLHRDYAQDPSLWRTSDLKTGYKFYQSKIRARRRLSIFASAVGAAAIVAGAIVLQKEDVYDSYGYQETYNKETGIGLMACGAAFPLPFIIFGSLNAKRYRSKAALVKQELTKRNEPLTQIHIKPGFDAVNKNVTVGLVMKF